MVRRSAPRAQDRQRVGMREPRTGQRAQRELRLRGGAARHDALPDRPAGQRASARVRRGGGIGPQAEGVNATGAQPFGKQGDSGSGSDGSRFGSDSAGDGDGDGYSSGSGYGRSDRGSGVAGSRGPAARATSRSAWSTRMSCWASARWCRSRKAVFISHG